MQYQLVSSGSITELIIKKSKFITILYLVEDEQQIKEKLLQLKKQYKDANHICYAYVLLNKEKYFDDGEPSGTAGLPILKLLKQNKLINVLAVVIRYFGGVKLGSGGLIRAYSNSVKEAVKTAQLQKHQLWQEFEFTIFYEELALLNQLKDEDWYQVINKEFYEKIKVIVKVNPKKIKELKTTLSNLFKREII